MPLACRIACVPLASDAVRTKVARPTFPRVATPRGRLEACDTAGEAAAGLGVVKAGKEGGAGEVLSLFVAPAYWRRGIGTRLLAALEAELAGRGCTSATLAYSTVGKNVPALEKMLACAGWAA